MVLGNRDDEQVAVRQADASGVYIKENQDDEDQMRDIQVSKRGSVAASGEDTDRWRKTVRFEQEARNASAFYGKDERKGRYIGEVLERYRGEDARDLKRSEVGQVSNALERKLWNMNPKILMVEKSWKTWKSGSEHRDG